MHSQRAPHLKRERSTTRPIRWKATSKRATEAISPAASTTSMKSPTLPLQLSWPWTIQARLKKRSGLAITMILNNWTLMVRLKRTRLQMKISSSRELQKKHTNMSKSSCSWRRTSRTGQISSKIWSMCCNGSLTKLRMTLTLMLKKGKMILMMHGTQSWPMLPQKSKIFPTCWRTSINLMRLQRKMISSRASGRNYGKP